MPRPACNKPKFCPSCGQRFRVKDSLNHRTKEKVFRSQCKCGAAYRLTPLAWYQR